MEPLLPATPETHILRLTTEAWKCDRCDDFLEGEAFGYFVEYIRPDPNDVTVRDAQLVLRRACVIEMGDKDALPE